MRVFSENSSPYFHRAVGGASENAAILVVDDDRIDMAVVSDERIDAILFGDIPCLYGLVP